MSCMCSLKYVFVIAGLVAALSSAAQGQFYQYTDRNGNIVFTDTPPSGSDANEKKTTDRGVYWSAPRREPEPLTRRGTGKAQDEPAQEKQRRPDYGGITVIMYKTSWCGYCKKAGAYVRSLGANLVEYDIEASPDRKEEMKAKSGGSSGVPLIDIGGILIHGYSPEAIKSAIEKVVSR